MLVAASLAGCDTTLPTATPERAPLAAEPRDVSAGVDAGLPSHRARAAFGRYTYTEHCVVCHGVDGRGDGPAGPALNPPATDFVADSERRARSPADYRDAIAEGVPGTGMLRWDHVLDEMALWDVAFYVWELGTSAGEVERGAALWDAACAGCHVPVGESALSATVGLSSPARAGLERAEAESQIGRAHPNLVRSLSDADLQALSEHLWTFLYVPSWKETDRP